ncbi:hypothetical protein ACIGEP_15470 [Microbacterium sp. NPDC077663]|uniref:hypothetical protein n=1 Tax=Microbacterium sp. NPDC077663 TaxID=3364189 RepID=UPI0037C651A2
MKMRHAASVFLLVDPVQDYEESLEVWGVYGSLSAAKVATRRARRANLSQYDQWRTTEVQRWRGHLCTDVWSYIPGERAEWRWRPGPDAVTES